MSRQSFQQGRAITRVIKSNDSSIPYAQGRRRHRRQRRRERGVRGVVGERHRLASGTRFKAIFNKAQIRECGGNLHEINGFIAYRVRPQTGPQEMERN